MCHLCDEYGDPEYGGGLWYFNPKNYARNMYKVRLPGEGLKGAEAGVETGDVGMPKTEDLVGAIEKGDQVEVDGIKEAIWEWRRRSGRDVQVIPLEDGNKVLELCSTWALMSCICRMGSRARDERSESEYTCMGLGVGMLKWERWPERYKGGVKFVNVEEAKEWNRKMDKQGFVHLLMLFGAPYIGGFCQCDYPDCIDIRMAVDFGVTLLKSHYAVVIDYDICNGCGICIQRCQFGAIKFEATIEKPNIDLFKCYGCGLCESGCHRGAIKLVERKSLPALAEVWR